jgi:hypothetical protein
MPKFEIELICLASQVIEVKAKSLKSARKKALKKNNFNINSALDEYSDCIKILIKEEHEIINSKTLKTSFTTLEVN